MYRAPKVEMGPLDAGTVVSSYQNVFQIDTGHAKKLAELTMGYPFAYQVLMFIQRYGLNYLEKTGTLPLQ